MKKNEQFELPQGTGLYRPWAKRDMKLVDENSKALAVLGIERKEDGNIAVYQHETLRGKGALKRTSGSVTRVMRAYGIDHSFRQTRAGEWWIFPTLFTAEERSDMGFRKRPVYLEDREVGEPATLRRYLVCPGSEYRLETVAPVLLALKEAGQSVVPINLLHQAVERARSGNTLH